MDGHKVEKRDPVRCRAEAAQFGAVLGILAGIFVGGGLKYLFGIELEPVIWGLLTLIPGAIGGSVCLVLQNRELASG